jgi:hypothetical protein
MGLIVMIVAGMMWAEPESGGARDRVKEAVEKLRAAGQRREQLLFERRMVKRELSSDGHVKSQTITTTRQDPWEELVVTRVIARDDKPLPPSEAAEQEEKLAKAVRDKRRGLNKPKTADEEWMNELPQALEFEHAGSEMRQGRVLEAYQFKPKAGYKAKAMRAKVFEKLRGKVWLDAQDWEVARAEIEVFDTVSMGFGMLGKLEAGTRFEMERKKWDSGVWFDEWMRVKFDLRVMMVKTMRQEIESRYSNVTWHPRVKATASVR